MNQLAFAKLVNFVSTDIVQAGKVINIINEDEHIAFPSPAVGDLKPAYDNTLNPTTQAVSSDSASDEIQFYIPDEIPLEMVTIKHTVHNFYNWLSTLINIKLEHNPEPFDIH